ncbi:hypothetical protein C2G38_2183309 [Gigaspora rosea]|uniref:Aminopeptidase N-like N-terminal domain-containing protein n=1 Tax=Gigaspora rosea TaxID=44941 RepID=A0A397VD63_9GLOM|nr:hypothetical protein C2G38_2183309 [Gigaspora rosea]
MADTGKRQILPTNVRPTHYDLTLTPDLKSFTFEETKTVSQIAIDISYNTQKQTVSLTFPEELPTGSKVALHLEFTGILNDQMYATDARRAFPLYDEPAIKAIFDITLITPSELTALSNMNVTQSMTHDGSKKCVKFATTQRQL